MDTHPSVQDPDQQPHYVGFWLRVVAVIIDSVLVLFLVVPLLYAVGALAPLQALALLYGAQDMYALLDGLQALNTRIAEAGGDPLSLLINFVLPAVAVILFWFYKSATPGKMVVGAAIVDAKTLGKPSTGQLIGRYLAYYLSTVVLMLGFLWIAFDRRKQGWHDKLAGTVVIRVRG